MAKKKTTSAAAQFSAFAKANAHENAAVNNSAGGTVSPAKSSFDSFAALNAHDFSVEPVRYTRANPSQSRIDYNNRVQNEFRDALLRNVFGVDVPGQMSAALGKRIDQADARIKAERNAHIERAVANTGSPLAKIGIMPNSYYASELEKATAEDKNIRDSLTAQKYELDRARNYVDLVKNTGFSMNAQPVYRDDHMSRFINGNNAAVELLPVDGKYDEGELKKRLEGLKPYEKTTYDRILSESGKEAADKYLASDRSHDDLIKEQVVYGTDAISQKYARMTQNEKDIYNYLYNVQGKKAADEYLDSISRILSQRNYAYQQDSVARKASADPFSAIMYSAASIPANLLSGVDFIENAAKKGISDLKELVTGEHQGPVDYYDTAMNATSFTTGVRGGISKALTDKFGAISLNEQEHPILSKILNGKSLGDVYNLGMSMLDSTTVAALPFGAAGTVLLGGAAGSQGIMDALAKGANDTQALSMGLLNGTFEALFEYVSLDKLLNSDTASLLKSFFQQGFTEGTEELSTSLFNAVADTLVMAEKSDYKRAVAQYMRDGMSQQEAERQAMADIAIGMGWDFVGGMVTGGIMDLGHNAIQARGYKTTYKDYQKLLNQEYQELNPGNKLSEKAQKRLDKGKNLTGFQTRRMVMENDAAIAKNGSPAVETEAAEQGETNQQRLSRLIREENQRNLPFSLQMYETRLNKSLGNPSNANRDIWQTSNKVSEAKAQAKPAALDSKEELPFTYPENQDDEPEISTAEQARQASYNAGFSGVPSSDVEGLDGKAYQEGAAASKAAAQKQDEQNAKSFNGKTGHKEGVVKGYGVKIADLKAAFNDQQGRAYRTISAIAKATGVNVVLYNSDTNESGNFTGENGRFSWDEDTIYVDINSGLLSGGDVGDLAKYSMLRTFSHEFTHFVEKWSAEKYNDLRKTVFQELQNRGQSVTDLIETAMANDNSGKLTYDLASREVTAEAMTDILRDSSFVQKLAQQDKPLFQKIREKLVEFLKDVKDYFASIGKNRSREAAALQEQVGDTVKYVQSIIDAFDEAALDAASNYQKSNAVDEEAAQEPQKPQEAKKEEPAAEAMEEEKPAQEAQEADEKPSEEIADTAKEEEPAQDSEQKETSPRISRSKHGFEIRDNIENGTTEVAFDSIPDIATRNALKKNKYRWNPAKKVWYGNLSHDVLLEKMLDWYDDPDEKVKVTKLSNENSEVPAAKPVEAPPAEKKEIPSVSITEAKQAAKNPSERAAARIMERFLNDENIADPDSMQPITAKDLYEVCNEAFGGTQAQGAYDRKDAYDALELAVNKTLMRIITGNSRWNGTVEQAKASLAVLDKLLSNLPTQTVRTEEQQQFQQFSTPPTIAYLASWVANINSSDSVLEPSAGIGGLATFAKAFGADVTVNELSKRRLELLNAVGFDRVYNENAEHIDDILPGSIKPTVVLMNPPFSSTAGRTTNNKTSNAELHINQALARLEDGGRLVAVLGKGMNNGDYSKYWNKLRENYTIRANLSIDGKNYKKYGTTWGVQIVVIDKVGAQTGETITGSFADLSTLPDVLEGIRNERRANQGNVPGAVEQAAPVAERKKVSERAGSRQAVSGAVSRGESAGSTVAESGEVAAVHVDEPAEPSGTVAESEPTVPVDAGKPESGRRRQSAASQNAPASVEEGHRGTGRRTDEQSSDLVQSGAGVPGAAVTSRTEEKSDDGVYATYTPPAVLSSVKSRKHPATLVESAAMSAVSMPKATYQHHLPDDVVNGNLSDAQMVTVCYAGQAHEQVLPNGNRRGFFIGDGTGVGKGRQIAGIILDNFMQGRTKALWISKSGNLFEDAVRDWTATTGRSKAEVLNQPKIKLADKIAANDGILFTSYDTLKSKDTKGKGASRLDQIVEWLGEDFDGVIAFDESHNMGNLLGTSGKRGKGKGSEKAKAGVELQRRLPKARVVYVSATGATEVANLAYAERLGLWGQGTAFNDANDFVTKIGSSGIAAMELVARDMKAMGLYTARSISYNGVTYDTIEHTMDAMQTEIYNTMSSAWQKTMQNINAALEVTGAGKSSKARSNAIGQYYGSMQRFYAQALTSMSMPSVIADMRKELASGRSCVLQIVNTNEAQMEKKLADAKNNGVDLEDLDMTPREGLLAYLRGSFPVEMYEEYIDDNGKKDFRMVRDSQGNPVISKEAVRKRDALIAEIEQMKIPDGPLEMLFDAFGADMVAEVTGRTRRVVPREMEDGSTKRVEERRSQSHGVADANAFQAGKKRILVFSDAGGTGKSYHADLSAKNQQQRVHYILQPGWRADNAVQGFGRTHRSNEASAPIYKLVTTNIKGQKRFTSTIARRLDQLGALTKGQRDTGSGMFSAKDNLETDLARDSLREFYKRLGSGKFEGIDGMKTLARLGLDKKFSDEYGNFKLDENIARDVGLFLNRILALEVDEQNALFDAFTSIYETNLDEAIAKGTLDTGMENVKADKIEVLDDKIVQENKGYGDTHYVQAKTFIKPTVVTTVAEMEQLRSGFVGVYRVKDNGVYAVYRVADKTDSYGRITKQYQLISPNVSGKKGIMSENSLKSRATALDKPEWQSAWDEEVKNVPEYNESTLHMLTGSLLPIWSYLPQEGSTKVKRIVAQDGSMYIGRIVTPSQIDMLLRKFSVARTMEKFTAAQVFDKALKNNTHFKLRDNRAQIFRSKVSGEWRLEFSSPNSWWYARTYPGMIRERISYVERMFIPNSKEGAEILDKILADNPVVETFSGSEDQFQQRNSPMTDRELLEIAATQLKMDGLTDGEQDALRIFQNRLDKVHELEEKRIEQGRLYREQRFTSDGDKDEAKNTLARMRELDRQIIKANNAILDVQDKAVLRKVLQKARNVVETTERKKADETLKRYRDRVNNAAAIKKYKKSIQADVGALTKWIRSPGNKVAYQHVPELVKSSVIPFLQGIDLTSERSLRGGNSTNADKAFIRNLQGLQNALANATTDKTAEEMFAGYFYLPPNFFDKLNELAENVRNLADQNTGTFVVNRMSSDELGNLAYVVHKLKEMVTKLSTFHANAMFEHAYEAGKNSVEALKGMSAGLNGGKLGKFVLFDVMRPAEVFERFGDGGKSIYDELRKGQSVMGFNAQKIIDFKEATYTAKEVKQFTNTTVECTIGGEAVDVPVSYLMGFYLLSKRPQALEHLLGDGLRIATYKSGKETISDVGHRMTIDEVNAIVGKVESIPRAKEIADALQKFMAEQGGAWGNYVSMARYGERQFKEKNYYPIHVDGSRMDSMVTDKPQNASLYSLLNAGFTKDTVDKAHNRVILYDVFDVFANHMASMAQYNAFALPILDAMKWLNYKKFNEVELEDGKKSKELETSLIAEMDRVYGRPNEENPGSGRPGYAHTFLKNIIKAFNGTEAQGVPTDTFGINAMHRYNMSRVAYNLRVVLQQPMAITRAATVLDFKSIMKGMNPAKVKQEIQDMLKHSGIAVWKNLGFYDINISRGLTSIIKGDQGILDNINEFGMKGAEFADRITWAAMWAAAKEQVKKRGVKPGTEEFYNQVNDLFDEVIYKTQVVDSVLTKNEFLRSKGALARMVGSFMSEPATTFSMLTSAYDKYRMDLKRGVSKQEAWKNNRVEITRTVCVYSLSALLLAAVTAVADAWRDDDDYETFGEKVLEHFKGNFIDEMMPLNKLPIARDFYELSKRLLDAWGVDTYGNEPRSVILQWADSLVKANEIFHDKVNGKETNYTWYGAVYKLLDAASGLTGLPVSPMTREVVGIWNNTVGKMAPSMKAKTYQLPEKSDIKYAFKDGHMTREEAISELVSKGIAIEENGRTAEQNAYWITQGWDAKEGESTSDFRKVDAAVKAGDKKAFDEAMQEMLDHGYERDAVIGHLAGKTITAKQDGSIGKLYKGDENNPSSLTEEEAMQRLVEFCGLTKDAAHWKIQGWNAPEGETSSPYRKVYDAIRNGGDFNAAVREMTSHGYDKKKVLTQAGTYINQMFKDGDVTKTEAITLLVRYCGVSREDAQKRVSKWKKE